MTRRLMVCIATLWITATPWCSQAATVVRHARTAHARSPLSAPAAPKAVTSGMPRTLEDVHIEGEIPVPQVLFITTRDPRRYMDFQHHRYLTSSAQLAEQTALPTWVVVTPGTTPRPQKEISR